MPRNRRHNSRRYLAFLVMCIFMLASSACVLKQDGRPGELSNALGAHAYATYPLSLGKGKTLTSISFAQAIAAACSDESLIEEIFASFPARQLDGLNLDEFRAYIRALSLNKRVVSFELLNSEEQARFAENIALKQPSLSMLAQTADYYMLLSKESESDKAQLGGNIVAAIQKNDAGEAFLARAWVLAVVRLHDFAQLYFDALDKHNSTELSWLLHENSRFFFEGDWAAFCSLRAKTIDNYYQKKVNTLPLSSEKTYILPGEACFSQNYQLSSRTSSIREVYIREQNGAILVFEPIPESLQEGDHKLSIYGQDFFPNQSNGMNPFYSHKSVHPLAGPVLAIEDISNAEPNEREQRMGRYRISYFGLKLTVRGKANSSEGSWEGVLENAEISSRIYSFGQYLKVGLPSSELYLRYPFIRENAFILKGSSGNYAVQLSLQLEKEHIAKLIWSSGK